MGRPISFTSVLRKKKKIIHFAYSQREEIHWQMVILSAMVCLHIEWKIYKPSVAQ